MEEEKNNKIIKNTKKQACSAGCAQTLPDATPPTGKIHPFSQIAVTSIATWMPFDI